MSDITLNTQSITGNHNFVPPGTDWNLGSGSKKWNGGYFGTIIADNGIPAGTAATGGDKIGQIRFSINPNIEPGYLALNGQEVNREDYPNLWAWVQQQVGFLIEESEWQSISEAHNGNVGKYSVGNGTTTFRLPNLGCWVRGGGTSGNNGGNLDAGLPNITAVHNWTGVTADNSFEGAFVGEEVGSGYTWNASKYYGLKLKFDASWSNPIYGKSSTVQPESIIGIWLVKAYHVPVDNMGNTITVNGIAADQNANIQITRSKNITLDVDNWVQGGDAGNTYTISDTDIKANSAIFLDVPVGTTTDNFNNVNATKLIAQSQSDGQLVLQALGELPSTNLNITLVII